MIEDQFNGTKTYAYKDFDKILKDAECKFNLILIDGPFGGDIISRSDILPFIPQILEENFVIMLDDFGRQGEINLAHSMVKKLSESSIEIAQGVYNGIQAKGVFVVTSKDLKFLTSL